MATPREELEQRVQALVSDFLDSMADQHPEGFEIGVFALRAEVKEPRSPDGIERMVGLRGRPEAR